MGLRFKRRQGTGGNVMKLVGGVITLVMALFIGGKVLASIATSLGTFNETGNPFYSALTFIGLSASGTWSTGAIVGVLGLAAIASFIMGYFRVSFR